MIGDDQEYDGPAEASQGRGPVRAPRPANGGNLGPMRTAVGGDQPPAGPARLLAARPPTPPELRTPNAGGRAFMAPPAGPSDNANGAFALAMGSQSPGNGGSPSVQAQQYSPFGNYTGSSGQGPHQAGIQLGGSPTIQTPNQGGALESFIGSHQPQQGGQQGQQGGPQQGGADEAEEGEAAGAGAEAGAGEAAGAGAEAGGAEIAAMFL